jgi:hypothetical protein
MRNPAPTIESVPQNVSARQVERSASEAWRWAFWLAAGALVLAKLALVADLSVEILFSPHDDSLYVERAFYLLRGEAFGPYDSRTLVKYPNISFWLAAVRGVGIPYLLSVQMLYVVAGLYFVGGLLRAGTARWLVLLALALYLFNPMTLGTWWTRVLREPLSTGLFVVFIAAWLHIMVSVERNDRVVLHGVAAAAVFAFALYIREEERLMWLLLAAFGAALAWKLRREQRIASAQGLLTLAVAIALPAVCTIAVGWSARAFVERNYGAPILHEFSEGEFPRLIVALRSIQVAKDNRMVMVPQEALAKVRAQVPEFAPVVARLPPPSTASLSCRLHGVCSEWSNGWMLFLIKDAAYYAGLTPNLPAAQAYYRSVRLAIERACAESRLVCRPTGTGLIPSMELRWTRAYVHELLWLLRLLLRPDPAVTVDPPTLYNVSVDLGRRTQSVTMTDYFDTQWQSSAAPDAHRLLHNPAAPLRQWIALLYLTISPVLIVALIAAVAFRMLSARPFNDVATLVGTIVLGFLGVRLLALAYLSVFMGALDSRLVLTTFTVAMLFAVPYLGSTFRALRH